MQLYEGQTVRGKVSSLVDMLRSKGMDDTADTLEALLGLNPMDVVTRYCYEVSWDEAQSVYFATVREFPKMGATGGSAEEALARLKVKVREEVTERGRTPLPSVIPLKHGG